LSGEQLYYKNVNQLTGEHQAGGRKVEQSIFRPLFLYRKLIAYCIGLFHVKQK